MKAVRRREEYVPGLSSACCTMGLSIIALTISGFCCSIACVKLSHF